MEKGRTDRRGKCDRRGIPDKRYLEPSPRQDATRKAAEVSSYVSILTI